MERYQNRNWLNQVLGRSVEKEIIDQSTAEKIGANAWVKDDHPLYKVFKAFVAFTGVMLVLAGVMIILTDAMSESEEPGKILAPIPGIIGALVFYAYRKNYRDSKLWKEVAATFFYLTFCVSFMLTLQVYEIDFIGPTWQLYLLLCIGLYMIYSLDSIGVALVYMNVLTMSHVITSLPALFLGGPPEMFDDPTAMLHGPSYFWSYLIWFFALGLLPYLKSRLDDSEEVSLGEAILGYYFFGVMFNVGLYFSAGLPLLSILVLIPLLYVISKRYFRHATWFFQRPLSSHIVLLVVPLVFLLSNKVPMELLVQVDLITDDWGLNQIFVLLVLAALGYYTYQFYKDELEPDGVQVNWLLVAAPAVIFVSYLFYLIAEESIGHYLMTLYGFWLAISYIQFGLKHRYAPTVILGAAIGIILLIIKIAVNIDDFIDADNEPQVIAVILLFIGAVHLGLVGHMKAQWSVTGNGNGTKPPSDALDTPSDPTPTPDPSGPQDGPGDDEPTGSDPTISEPSAGPDPAGPTDGPGDDEPVGTDPYVSPPAGPDPAGPTAGPGDDEPGGDDPYVNEPSAGPDPAGPGPDEPIGPEPGLDSEPPAGPDPAGPDEDKA